MDFLDVILWLAMAVEVLLCPYSKVEESFNLQATHDILFERDLQQYDHLEFPGVVPRTFLGPLAVSSVSSPLITLASILRLGDKFLFQCIVRLVLGTMVLFALSLFRRSVQQKFGSNVSQVLAILTLSQFHFLFYSSRTLPNVFALAIVLLAYHYWVADRLLSVIAALAFTAVVFRSEVVVLMGPMVLLELASGRLQFIPGFITGAVAGTLSLALTVLVDSYFWGRWLWPEGEVLWFNTYENKSHEWGTLPFHWYFTSALPKSLTVAYLLAPFSLILDRRISRYAVPVLAFLVLYSWLPHKELRFVFYALPIFNLMAAKVAVFSFQNINKSLFYRLVSLAICGGVMVSLAGSIFMLWVSSLNYPGGEALRLAHSLIRSDQVYLHLDVGTAMTGASRFGQSNPRWWYSKTEDLELSEYSQFTHLLTCTPNNHTQEFTTLGRVRGFDGVRVTGGFPFVHVETKEIVFIMERKEKGGRGDKRSTKGPKTAKRKKEATSL